MNTNSLITKPVTLSVSDPKNFIEKGLSYAGMLPFFTPFCPFAIFYALAKISLTSLLGNFADKKLTNLNRLMTTEKDETKIASLKKQIEETAAKVKHYAAHRELGCNLLYHSVLECLPFLGNVLSFLQYKKELARKTAENAKLDEKPNKDDPTVTIKNLEEAAAKAKKESDELLKTQTTIAQEKEQLKKDKAEYEINIKENKDFKSLLILKTQLRKRNNEFDEQATELKKLNKQIQDSEIKEKQRIQAYIKNGYKNSPKDVENNPKFQLANVSNDLESLKDKFNKSIEWDDVVKITQILQKHFEKLKKEGKFTGDLTGRKDLIPSAVILLSDIELNELKLKSTNLDSYVNSIAEWYAGYIIYVDKLRNDGVLQPDSKDVTKNEEDKVNEKITSNEMNAVKETPVKDDKKKDNESSLKKSSSFGKVYTFITKGGKIPKEGEDTTSKPPSNVKSKHKTGSVDKKSDLKKLESENGDKQAEDNKNTVKTSIFSRKSSVNSNLNKDEKLTNGGSSEKSTGGSSVKSTNGGSSEKINEENNDSSIVNQNPTDQTSPDKNKIKQRNIGLKNVHKKKVNEEENKVKNVDNTNVTTSKNENGKIVEITDKNEK